MCIVSNMGDYWTQRTLPEKYPMWSDIINNPSRAEFEQLKKDVEELKRLLKAAKRYDEKVGEPHCEVEDKVILIKKIADAVGVDLKGIFD